MLLPLACLKRYFLKVLKSLSQFVQHYQRFKGRPKFDEGIFESYVHLNLVVLDPGYHLKYFLFYEQNSISDQIKYKVIFVNLSIVVHVKNFRKYKFWISKVHLCIVVSLSSSIQLLYGAGLWESMICTSQILLPVLKCLIFLHFSPAKEHSVKFLQINI